MISVMLIKPKYFGIVKNGFVIILQISLNFPMWSKNNLSGRHLSRSDDLFIFTTALYLVWTMFLWWQLFLRHDEIVWFDKTKFRPDDIFLSSFLSRVFVDILGVSCELQIWIGFGIQTSLHIVHRYITEAEFLNLTNKESYQRTTF